jgi:ABC-type oligopeptide transport system ATPase subunit
MDMSVKKIKFLVGMPGSGKTTLGEALVKEASPSGSIIFIDDISIVTKNAKEYLSSLKLDGVSEILISDVYFCRSKVRESAISIIKEVFPNIPIEMIFFENSAGKCLINVAKRAEKGDDRKVTGLIQQLSKEYVIPNSFIPIEIKHEVQTKLKR